MQENGNPALKYIMCCLRCLLWFLERIVKFINRNAYIMVAVKGTGYCQSAGKITQERLKKNTLGFRKSSESPDL